MAKAKAKKAKEVKEAKKINLKLKKQIRLTLGAILMISAIVVALIPPGNIEAGDKADAVNPTDDTRGVPAYPSSPSFPTSPSFLQKPATIPHTSYTIYPLSGANDSWAYVPQFFYSVTNAIPNTQGNFVIINGYSSLLPADQIKLDNFLAQEYFTVSEEKYNNFFSANQGSDFSTCPGSGHTDPSKCNHWRVSTGPDVQGGPGSTPYTYSYSDWYTRDEGRPGAPLGVSPDMTYIKAQEEWVTAYNAYKDQCAAFYKYVETDIPKYNTDLSTYLNGTAYLDWVSGGSVGAEPVGRPTEPTSVSQPGGSFTGLGAFTITRDSDGYFNLSPAAVGNYHLFVGVPFSRTPADLSPDKKFRFYCQYTEGLMGKSGDPNFIHRLPGLGFSLKLVQDVASSTPLTAAYVYVPRGGTLIDEPGTALDSNGFLVNIRSQMVIGIGDEAFQMVGNVDTLIFPDEIAYIGDRAFEGSFIKSLNLANVTNVGNQAFKGCTQLTSLSMNDGLRIIGGEAFFGSGLLNVTLPYSVREIGLGAFAKSHSLVTVDMSKMDWDPISIKDFAFYDCSVLKEVKFTDKRNSFDIGTAAFALETAGQGAMETITLPKNITGVAGSALGNWLFSGRMGLKSVIMPESYGTDGSKGTIYIPSGMFRMCTGLEFVEFPNVANGRNGGYVSYNPSSDDIAPANYHPTDNSASYVGKYLFLDVTNPNFYVRGPETSQNGRIALPRRSTWSAFTQVSDFVPYRYINSAGVQCYEISDGEYILQANASGQLTGCQLVDDTDWNGTNPINLVIPEFVGDIKISDIASGALSNKNLRSRLRSLTISNNTLTSVAPEAFKGLPRLEEVVIGNTVKEVGKEAFADCPLLTNVTFNSPSGFAHKDFILGEGAFKTNSKKLVLNGDIVPGYAPFEFAMDPVEGNIAFDLNGNPTGLRILYKSLSPSLLTVMYDIDQKEVVLLNYPKFDQIDNNKAYLDSMERYYTRMYGGIDYDQARDDFVLAYQAAANPDTLYDSDLFGPWISRAYLDDPTENGRRTPDPAIVLNPAGGIDGIKSYYGKSKPSPSNGVNDYSIIDNYFNPAPNPWEILTLTESQMIFATQNIIIPAGITSIDAKSYFAPNSMGSLNSNVANHSVYFNTTTCNENDPNHANKCTSYIHKSEMNMLMNNSCNCTCTHIPAHIPGSSCPDYEKVVVGGLFSGCYNDNSDKEVQIKGNDQIITVHMSTVKKLPDYAFDSCEKLEYVVLGDAMTDIGTAPFRGASSMTTVAGNDNYIVESGIIYSKYDRDKDNNKIPLPSGGFKLREDGSYSLEQVLGARGDDSLNWNKYINQIGALNNGKESTISSATDTLLPLVSYIDVSAFEDCDFITGVDLKKATQLTTIPDNCFNDCDKLSYVDLPVSVNQINKLAFGGNKNITVFIPGKEVQIATDAFEHVKSNTIQTYEDTSAHRYGDYYNIRVILLRGYKVTFVDTVNGEIIESLDLSIPEDEPGKEVMVTFPPHPGDDPSHYPGYLANGWTPDRKTVTESTNFYTLYKSVLETGVRTVTFYDPISNEVVSTQNVDIGKDAVVPANATHRGYTFVGWVPADAWKNIQDNVTLLAHYRSTSGSGGNTGPGTSSTDDEAGTFTVSVSGGSGSGRYVPGTVVTIGAFAGTDGKVFDKWTTASTGVGFLDANSPVTVFTMPGNNVAVTATYKNGLTSTTGGGSAANNASGGGSGGGSTSLGTGGSGSSTTGRTNATVEITKPGIPNRELASASVSGSLDNYVVKISEDAAATAYVIEALQKQFGNLDRIRYFPMDISLYDATGTYKITDTSGLSISITMPLPSDQIPYGASNRVASAEGGTLEHLNPRFSTIDGVPCVTFTATHFSPYVIYADLDNLTFGTMDNTPKTGDGVHPKWFLAIGLACLSMIFFLKREKMPELKTT